MNQKYSNEQKAAILERYSSGESISSIVSSTGLPRSTIYSWIKQS